MTSGLGSDLCFLSGVETAGLIRKKQVSPVDVMKAVLRQAEEVGQAVNAFTVILGDQALDEARRAETAVMNGDAVGVLHGVPVTIKDISDTKSIRTERGSCIFKGNIPVQDSPVVTRLKNAGAIVFGKTTTPELGWTAVSRSPLTGITHNPWKHAYNAGGSSAGAAAAAATGCGPIHQGGDAAGSIRLPAHFCGVYGLKPTFGRIPVVPADIGDCSVHLGPLTRTVADAAAMLQASAGPHPLDQLSCEAMPPDYLELLKTWTKGKRIGFTPDLGHARVNPEVADLVKNAASVFSADLGAHVETIKCQWGGLGPELIRFFWPAHLTGYAKYLPQWRDKMDPGLVECINSAISYTVVDYQQMRERKRQYCEAIHRTFEQWDYLIMPTASVPAFPAHRLQPPDWPQHEWDWFSWAEFTYPFNYTGNPAASLPCGFTGDGLPVGVQIVGRRFDDLGVLQASAAFEAARPWRQRHPPCV